MGIARGLNRAVAGAGQHGRMLGAAEAASRLGVKIGTLYAYVSRGWLRSYRRRVGRQALYRRVDVEALRGLVAAERGRRARGLPEASSWITIAQRENAFQGPASGVVVTESAVSSTIEGCLAYRGYPIEEVVRCASFEEVCLLLWKGERPGPGESAEFGREIASARMPAPVARALDALGAEVAALLRLSAMMPSLAAWERRGKPLEALVRARFIIAMLALALVPASRRPSAGRGGMAERLVAALGNGPAAEWELAAMNRMLVACAEHEMNASTFAARVVASTGADLYASVLAALCSLAGPLHGGACGRIEQMFSELAAGLRLDDCLDGFQREGQLPPGFGHAMYPEGDPRAVLLKETAADIVRHRGRKLYETALQVEHAVLRRERLRPNLDFYLTVCARMLGFPRGLPGAIFAVGRAAGWIAHSLEQYANNRLIRPRMRYRGAALRHWE